MNISYRSRSSPCFRPMWRHSARATDTALPDLRGWIRSCETTPTATGTLSLRLLRYLQATTQRTVPPTASRHNFLLCVSALVIDDSSARRMLLSRRRVLHEGANTDSVQQQADCCALDFVSVVVT